MAAPVPAVERATRILELMADSPGEHFTAAQLAAALGIHRATCFSILSCLANLDLVRRDPDRKTYRLGPQLLRLGTAAANQTRGVPSARREMFHLADQLDVGGLVSVPVGWDIVLVDRVTDDPAFGVPPPDVVHTALQPPLGAIFVAWSAPAVIAEWLRRSPPDATDADLESFRQSVAAVRARGYSLGSETEVEVQLEAILARLQRGEIESLAVALELADLVRTGREARFGAGSSAQDQHIDHLIGPVFDEAAEVILTITIFGRSGQIRSTNLAEFAAPLLGACARVTRDIGGAWSSRAPGPAVAGLGSP